MRFVESVRAFTVLHFAKWLLTLTPERHDLIVGVDDHGYDDKFAAMGAIAINLATGTKDALRAYYDKLWEKNSRVSCFPIAMAAPTNKRRFQTAASSANMGAS